jgi:leucine-rich repeat protein SHOC2
MKPAELEEIIEQAIINKKTKLVLRDKELTILPESIGSLTSLTTLNLACNSLNNLPECIGNLVNLTELYLHDNQLIILPASMSELTNLTYLSLTNNPLVDISILKKLPKLKTVNFVTVDLHHRYWDKVSNWDIKQLFDEQDVLVRRTLVEFVFKKNPHAFYGHLSLGNADLTNLPESIGDFNNLTRLDLYDNLLTNLPESIGNLTNLTGLNLSNNQLTNLPERIGCLTNLTRLDLGNNQLTNLPESICNLTNLTELILHDNQLTNLPESIYNLINLIIISLDNNPLVDLSILQKLPSLKRVEFIEVDLPRRYWTKFSDWKTEWLLDEDNAEIRRVLIEQLGYKKICDELNAVVLDHWREYTLLKIDGVEVIDREPMVLLKMTCPSTAHIHILRVPPEMESAEEAITWVNHGIHPDQFAIQT